MQVSQVKCQTDQLKKKSQNNNRDVEFMRYDEKKNLNENEKKIKVNSMRLKTQETKFK